MDASSNDTRKIISVSDLNLALKQTIGSNFPLLWVEGEISNLARPASGHLYFSLKDSTAQIRCVMFRTNNRKVSFAIENGLQVIIRAKASLYEPRGDLQLIAEDMEEAGFGALQRQFEKLKNKLHTEGLFAEERKTPIPRFPNEIAIITSPSGAAIKDFVKVAHRRFPQARKFLYAVPVQGDDAAIKICSAINEVNRTSSADVIALVRGGGSIEDLWAFNDERLARTIADSRIPVVTGIGHEIDYTISDFVADLRAPTPSIAAEYITPELETLNSYLTNKSQVLHRIGKEIIEIKFQNVDWMFHRLRQYHPSAYISSQQKELRNLINRLLFKSKHFVQTKQNEFNLLGHKLKSCTPSIRLANTKASLLYTIGRLGPAIHHLISQKSHQLQISAATLNAISPLATLDRGYSITVKSPNNSIVTNPKQIKAGDQLITYLATGRVVSRVESTSSESMLEQLLLPHSKLK